MLWCHIETCSHCTQIRSVGKVCRTEPVLAANREMGAARNLDMSNSTHFAAGSTF